MISSAILVALFAFSSIVLAQSRNSLELERNILKKIFENYDSSVRPAGENGTGPVVVEVNTFIRSLSNIDDVKMAYDAQLTFRQSWNDDRLRYDSQGQDYVTLSDPNRLWIPDLFFSNEADGHFHNLITPNVLIRIYPDGRILYSIRISLHLMCPMDLKQYPMDTQICNIIGASYGYTTRDIVFVWKKGDPVQITKNLHLQKFTLNWFRTDYCNSKTNTGEYSCVKIEMSFSRNMYYYLIRAYLPTTTLVFLSWAVFWLNPRCSNLRLGIWVGVLVSNMILATSISASSPEVSYTKAIDVWMGTCVSFIFCVLIELCLVNNAITNEDRSFELKNQINLDDPLGDKIAAKGDDHGKRVHVHHYSSSPLKWLNKYSTKAQRIDVVSRFFFPAVFAFFNFIYWITFAPSRV